MAWVPGTDPGPRHKGKGGGGDAPLAGMARACPPSLPHPSRKAAAAVRKALIAPFSTHPDVAGNPSSQGDSLHTRSLRSVPSAVDPGVLYAPVRPPTPLGRWLVAPGARQKGHLSPLQCTPLVFPQPLSRHVGHKMMAPNLYGAQAIVYCPSPSLNPNI